MLSPEKTIPTSEAYHADTLALFARWARAGLPGHVHDALTRRVRRIAQAAGTSPRAVRAHFVSEAWALAGDRLSS